MLMYEIDCESRRYGEDEACRTCDTQATLTVQHLKQWKVWKFALRKCSLRSLDCRMGSTDERHPSVARALLWGVAGFGGMDRRTQNAS